MDILKLGPFVSVPENYTGICEYSSGTLVYYVNGLRHREDGPAVIYTDGIIYWFINGENITYSVNKWLSGKTNITPYKKWDKDTRLIFKLTFG